MQVLVYRKDDSKSMGSWHHKTNSKFHSLPLSINSINLTDSSTHSSRLASGCFLSASKHARHGPTYCSGITQGRTRSQFLDTILCEAHLYRWIHTCTMTENIQLLQPSGFRAYADKVVGSNCVGSIIDSDLKCSARHPHTHCRYSKHFQQTLWNLLLHSRYAMICPARGEDYKKWIT